MTQEQALSQVRAMFPEIAADIRLDRQHSIGKHFGHDDQFYIWHHPGEDAIILASSEHNWEHAIALINPDHIKASTPADHSPVEAQ